MGQGLIRARTPFATGKVAFGAVPGTYGTLLGPVSDVRKLIIMNTLDTDVAISLNGGTTTLILLPGIAGGIIRDLTIDFDISLAYSGTISLRHDGAAPTAGFICAGVITGI